MTEDARIAVTTAPFGAVDPTPLRRLAAAGVSWRGNPFGRRLQADEVAAVIGGAEAVIAGTEPITAATLAACPDLRVVCRVGVGLDSVDLAAARERGVAVAYTPEAPAPAVAELAIGLLLALFRGVARADRGMRNGGWERISGRRLGASTVGVVGVGRIGGRVAAHLAGGFPGVRVLACDPVRRPLAEAGTADAVTWCGLDELLRESDAVTLHVPLTPATRSLIGPRAFDLMRPDAFLINTARGGVVDEAALAAALEAGRIAGAAVDVFDREPYHGPLTRLPTALLTSHMGSMTADCRARMELEATEDALRFLAGEPLRSPVPPAEFALAEERRR